MPQMRSILRNIFANIIQRQFVEIPLRSDMVQVVHNLFNEIIFYHDNVEFNEIFIQKSLVYFN